LGALASLRYFYFNDNDFIGALPVELMDLTALLDSASDLCGNHVHTGNNTLADFLDTKQIGGDWENCQAPFVPAVSRVGLMMIFALLALAAWWGPRNFRWPGNGRSTA
jgi:hypothetical protein